MVDKTKKVLNQFRHKSKPEQRTAIGTDMYLPNHSGIATHPEAIKTFANSSHTHDAADVISGTFDDARISQSSVTQHEAALSITESQISDLHDSNKFKTISVSGQSDVVADSSTDTLTLAEGSNVTITTNPTTDTITIAASGGGGGAPVDAQYVTLATDATLTNERVLTAGTNISFVDGGAGGTLTINNDNNELNDLDDVAITSVGNGEVLYYDTFGWKNGTLAEVGIAAASHTHTASDVTDFSEAVDDRVSNLLVEGTGISLQYNDGFNILTISVADNYLLNTGDTCTGSLTMSSTNDLIFNGANNYIEGTDSNTLRVAAGTTQNFFIGGAEEMDLTANYLTFNNGASDTRLYWGVNNELGFQAGGQQVMKIDDEVVHFEKGHVKTPVTIDNTYTIGTDEHLIFYDGRTNAPYTISLPSSVDDGQVFILKENGGVGGSTVTLTVSGGAAKIDGASSVSLTTGYRSICVVYNSGTSEYNILY